MVNSKRLLKNSNTWIIHSDTAYATAAYLSQMKKKSDNSTTTPSFRIISLQRGCRFVAEHSIQRRAARTRWLSFWYCLVNQPNDAGFASSTRTAKSPADRIYPYQIAAFSSLSRMGRVLWCRVTQQLTAPVSSATSHSASTIRKAFAGLSPLPQTWSLVGWTKSASGHSCSTHGLVWRSGFYCWNGINMSLIMENG